MFAKEEGVPVDPAALEAQIGQAVAEVVRQQMDAGIDIVNDGEMSKPSYATYIKDRLAGFGGTRQPLQLPGSRRFPGAGQQRLRRSRPLAAQDAGLQRRRSPCATAAAVEADIANLKAAIDAARAAEGS